VEGRGINLRGNSGVRVIVWNMMDCMLIDKDFDGWSDVEFRVWGLGFVRFWKVGLALGVGFRA
jgi:hypothetical protein